MEAIVAGAALETVGAGAAPQRVLAVAAAKLVLAVVANEGVAARATVDVVVAASACQLVVAAGALQDVRAPIRGPAAHQVRAGVADEAVGSEVAEEERALGAREQHVVAGTAIDRLDVGVHPVALVGGPVVGEPVGRHARPGVARLK